MPSTSRCSVRNPLSASEMRAMPSRSISAPSTSWQSRASSSRPNDAAFPLIVCTARRTHASSRSSWASVASESMRRVSNTNIRNASRCVRICTSTRCLRASRSAAACAVTSVIVTRMRATAPPTRTTLYSRCSTRPEISARGGSCAVVSSSGRMSSKTCSAEASKSADFTSFHRRARARGVRPSAGDASRNSQLRDHPCSMVSDGPMSRKPALTWSRIVRICSVRVATSRSRRAL